MKVILKAFYIILFIIFIFGCAEYSSRTGVSLVTANRSYSLAVVLQPLIAVASVAAEPGL